ncbi:solute carrier organic anion transporter family member 4A1 [Trichinella spiralis]|uniref:solute carrier organic anion transporter family member 4A1 n=1 Tax=Trichinella spiralis TaxID=6334 RepID=UPI0001EFE09E|nr:solute carrier organic anion transporter family member 4A1 [Trichinella spiralis]
MHLCRTTDSVLMDVGFGQACNDHCSCSVNEYHPVCGRVQNVMSVYSNCTCVDDGAVSVGWCESSCSSLSIFLFLFAPMCFVTFSVGVPALSVVLREIKNILFKLLCCRCCIFYQQVCRL